MRDGDILTEPIYYLDTSVIVKRYVNEEGTEFSNTLYEYEIQRGGRLYSAEHSISEVGSSFYRKMREGKLLEEVTVAYIELFLRESKTVMEFINTDNNLYVRSLNFLRKHSLRAGDAVHLAAALNLYAIHGSDLHFVSDDVRQCDAAAAEGLHVLKPREVESIDFLQSFVDDTEENEEEQK